MNSPALELTTALAVDLPQAATPVRRDVSALDAETFSNLLGGTSPPVLKAPAVALAPGANGAFMGDTILKGLQGVGEQLRGKWQEVESVSLQTGSLSVADMLRMQMQMTMLSYTTEFASAIVKKSSTAVDQLVHTQ